jgi:hypothetical protein
VTQDGRKVHLELVRTYIAKERPLPDQPGVMEACEALDEPFGCACETGLPENDFLAQLTTGSTPLKHQINAYRADFTISKRLAASLFPRRSRKELLKTTAIHS